MDLDGNMTQLPLRFEDLRSSTWRNFASKGPPNAVHRAAGGRARAFSAHLLPPTHGHDPDYADLWLSYSE